MRQRIFAPVLFAASALSSAAEPATAQDQPKTLISGAELLVQPFLDSTRRMVDIESPSLDDKGGIALALMAVRLLRDSGRDAFETITLLSTTDEEKQSAGSKDLIKVLAREHDVAFVLEFGTPDDRIVLSRKGIGYLRVTVAGKAAHAGAEPEKGCNAAMEMAFQLIQMKDLGRPERQTSVNFTLLNGGERSNIIPAEAKAQADVRVLDPDEFDRLENDAAFLAATQQLFRCSKVRTSLEMCFGVEY